MIGRLPQLRALHVGGADAARFLNNQLCSKVEADATTPGLSAWLNAKGRVVTDFWICPVNGAYTLYLHAGLAETVHDGLRRFVFRDKVELALAPADAVTGVIGALPESLTSTAEGIVAGGTVTGLRLPGRGERALLLDPDDELGAHGDLTAEWRRRDIEAGVLIVDPDLSEQYLAQNLNLDALDAISFDKGCYPGQEIVARVKYRGRVKQRMYTARLPGNDDVAARTRIVDGADGRAVGEVMAVRTPEAGDTPALVLLDVDAAGSALVLEGAGRRVELGELPYPVEV